MLEISAESKYFTFYKKGLKYIFKSVAPSQKGEGDTIWGLRRVFNNYEQQGYKYISPCEYEKIENSLYYINL